MTNRQIMWLGIVVFCVVMMLPLPAPAQGQRDGGGQRAPAPPPTNLQVLPKDWTRQQVVQVMQQFNMALGVMCDHCHAAQAGAQPGPNGQIPRDFASDEMATKKTARVMLRMVSDINNTFGSQLGKPAADVVKVQCVTCHRGSAIPKTQ